MCHRVMPPGVTQLNFKSTSWGASDFVKPSEIVIINVESDCIFRPRMYYGKTNSDMETIGLMLHII